MPKYSSLGKIENTEHVCVLYVLENCILGSTRRGAFPLCTGANAGGQEHSTVSGVNPWAHVERHVKYHDPNSRQRDWGDACCPRPRGVQEFVEDRRTLRRCVLSAVVLSGVLSPEKAMRSSTPIKIVGPVVQDNNNCVAVTVLC